MFDDPQGLMDNPNSELYHHFLECGTVCTDSRNIIPGSIFFALKGTSFDGNRFASQAINDGAAFAVVDDPACTPDNRYILVPDCLKACSSGDFDGAPYARVDGELIAAANKQKLMAAIERHLQV